MNESSHEWINKIIKLFQRWRYQPRIKKSTNEWIDTNQIMNEWMNEWTKQLINEIINELSNELVNEWINEFIDKWIRYLMNEWMK